MKFDKTNILKKFLLTSFFAILLGIISLFAVQYYSNQYEKSAITLLIFFISILFMAGSLNGNRLLQIILGLLNLGFILIFIQTTLIIIQSKNHDIISYLILSLLLIHNSFTAFILLFKGKTIIMDLESLTRLKGKKKLQKVLFFLGIFLLFNIPFAIKTKWEVKNLNHYQINLPKHWTLIEEDTASFINQKNNDQSFIITRNYKEDFTKVDMGEFKKNIFEHFENYFKESFDNYELISKTEDEIILKEKLPNQDEVYYIIKDIYSKDKLIFIISCLYSSESSTYKEVHKKIFDSIKINIE